MSDKAGKLRNLFFKLDSEAGRQATTRLTYATREESADFNTLSTNL